MRTILPYTKNPSLRESAREVPVADIQSKHIRSLIADMKILLSKEEYGVALAAPQIGESVQLFIVSGTAKRKRAEKLAKVGSEDELGSEQLPSEDTVYINPLFLKMSRKKSDKHEGCLSIRGKWGTVPRAKQVRMRWYDENGAKHERGFSDFLAHVFQHEMDHLQGILYIDKATHLYDEERK